MAVKQTKHLFTVDAKELVLDVTRSRAVWCLERSRGLVCIHTCHVFQACVSDLFPTAPSAEIIAALARMPVYASWLAPEVVVSSRWAILREPRFCRREMSRASDRSWKSPRKLETFLTLLSTNGGYVAAPRSSARHETPRSAFHKLSPARIFSSPSSVSTRYRLRHTCVRACSLQSQLLTVRTVCTLHVEVEDIKLLAAHVNPHAKSATCSNFSLQVRRLDRPSVHQPPERRRTPFCLSWNVVELCVVVEDHVYFLV